jgi:hypothetical protein
MLRHTIGSRWINRQSSSQLCPIRPKCLFFHLYYQFIAGSPTIWSGRPFPFTLQPDDDFVYVDRYSARCPNIRCCHFWPLRTRYMARRWRHLSTGLLWTSSRTATARLRKLLRWLNRSRLSRKRGSRLQYRHPACRGQDPRAMPPGKPRK